MATIHRTDHTCTRCDLSYQVVCHVTPILWLWSVACGGGISQDGPAIPQIRSPARLAFVIPPVPTVAGDRIGVTVAVEDAAGAVVSTATNSITLTIASGPPGATIGGTSTVSARNGFATFTDLTMTAAGSGYVLAASSPTISRDVSASFTITPAIPSGLAFITEPRDVTAGEGQTVAVSAADRFGNRVQQSGIPITLAIAAGLSGPFNGTLSRTTDAGVATFPNLSLVRAGYGYRLAALATGLSPAASRSFSVLPGAPVRGWLDPTATVVGFPEGNSAGISSAASLTPHLLDAFDNAISAVWTWSSDDPHVASVDARGVVSAFGVGQTIVRAAAGGRTLTADVATVCRDRCSGGGASLSTPIGARAGAVLSIVQYNQPLFGCASGTISLRLGANATGAILSGNSDFTITCSHGAAWPSLKIDRPGTYSLVALINNSSTVSWGFTVAP
jgi:hypothetical protein